MVLNGITEQPVYNPLALHHPQPTSLLGQQGASFRYYSTLALCEGRAHGYRLICGIPAHNSVDLIERNE